MKKTTQFRLLTIAVLLFVGVLSTIFLFSYFQQTQKKTKAVEEGSVSMQLSTVLSPNELKLIGPGSYVPMRIRLVGQRPIEGVDLRIDVEGDAFDKTFISDVYSCDANVQGECVSYFPDSLISGWKTEAGSTQLRFAMVRKSGVLLSDVVIYFRLKLAQKVRGGLKITPFIQEIVGENATGSVTAFTPVCESCSFGYVPFVPSSTPFPTDEPASITLIPTPTVTPYMQVNFKNKTGAPVNVLTCRSYWETDAQTGEYTGGERVDCADRSTMTVAVRPGNRGNIGVFVKSEDGVVVEAQPNPVPDFISTYDNHFGGIAGYNYGWSASPWKTGKREINFTIIPPPITITPPTTPPAGINCSEKQWSIASVRGLNSFSGIEFELSGSYPEFVNCAVSHPDYYFARVKNGTVTKEYKLRAGSDSDVEIDSTGKKIYLKQKGDVRFDSYDGSWIISLNKCKGYVQKGMCSEWTETTYTSACLPSGNTEYCNQRDDDCNGQIDEGLSCAPDIRIKGVTIIPLTPHANSSAVPVKFDAVIENNSDRQGLVSFSANSYIENEDKPFRSTILTLSNPRETTTWTQETGQGEYFYPGVWRYKVKIQPVNIGTTDSNQANNELTKTFTVKCSAQIECQEGKTCNLETGLCVDSVPNTPTVTPSLTQSPTPPPTDTIFMFRVKAPDISNTLTALPVNDLEVKLVNAQNQVIQTGLVVESVNRVEILDSQGGGNYLNITLKRPGNSSQNNVQSFAGTLQTKLRTSTRSSFAGVNIIVGKTRNCTNLAGGDGEYAAECGELGETNWQLVAQRPLLGGDANGFTMCVNCSYNKIDSYDLSILNQYYDASVQTNPTGWSQAQYADFNMDGRVDVNDLGILGKNYMKTGQ